MSAVDRPALVSFANHLVIDWDEAMDKFFQAVAKKQAARDLTDSDVEAALQLGYGDEVAEAWQEWAE